MTPAQEIERDLDWRQGEIAVLKVLLKASHTSETEKNVLYRAGWALLYAHYEGFTKFALTVYYDTIQTSGKLCSQLDQATQAFALTKQIKSLKRLPELEFLLQIQTFQTDSLARPPIFPEVDTRSNLWPDVLSDLLSQAELNLCSLTQFNQTLKTLVKRRNNIAHGQKDMIKDFDYYSQFEECTQLIMYDLAITIVEKIEGL